MLLPWQLHTFSRFRPPPARALDGTLTDTPPGGVLADGRARTQPHCPDRRAAAAFPHPMHGCLAADGRGEQIRGQRRMHSHHVHIHSWTVTARRNAVLVPPWPPTPAPRTRQTRTAEKPRAKVHATACVLSDSSCCWCDARSDGRSPGHLPQHPYARAHILPLPFTPETHSLCEVSHVPATAIPFPPPSRPARTLAGRRPGAGPVGRRPGEHGRRRSGRPPAQLRPGGQAGRAQRGHHLHQQDGQASGHPAAPRLRRSVDAPLLRHRPASRRGRRGRRRSSSAPMASS